MKIAQILKTIYNNTNKAVLLGALLLIALFGIHNTTDAQTRCTPNDEELAEGVEYEGCERGFSFISFNRYIDYPLTDGGEFDETNFFRILDDDFNFTDRLTVEEGDEVKFYGYIHNNCDASLNDEGRGECIAQNVRAAIEGFLSQDSNFITPDIGPGVSYNFNMNVSSTNSNPETVTDFVTVINGEGEAIRIKYKVGTAKVQSPETGIKNFLPSGDLFRAGARLTSINKKLGIEFPKGTMFASEKYRLEIGFVGQVELAPPPPGNVCIDLKLKRTKFDAKNRIAEYQLISIPPEFLDDVEISITGSGRLEKVGEDRFTVLGFDETTVIVAEVPDSPQCKVLIDFKEVPPPPPENLCIDLKIQPNVFVPSKDTQTFTATTLPPNYESVQWQIVQGNPDVVGVRIDPQNPKVASFTNLQPDHVIRAFGTRDIAPGSTCEDFAKSKFGPGEFCTGAILKPRLYPQTGELQRFKFQPIPANYQGRFVWSSPTGVFADGNQIGNPLITDSMNVAYRGGVPGGQITVVAEDPQFAAVCKAAARAGNVPPEPNKNLIKAVDKKIANPGDVVKYTVIYTKDPFFTNSDDVTIFDTLGREGQIRGSQGGVIRPTGSMGVSGLRPCGSPTQTNCYIGSILKPAGVTLQNLTTTQPITITYQGIVDTKISEENCKQLNPRNGGCGERFVNEAFDTQGHLARAQVTVLCPAFRSFGFGDILLEEAFKTGIDTASCGDKPNTEGIVVAPKEEQDDNRIVSTGANDATLPQHGFCKEQQSDNTILDRISSQFCELDSRFDQQIYSLNGVKQNADRLCLNALRRNATINSGSLVDIQRYLNENNPNENIGCFDTLTINGPIQIDNQITFIARDVTINGDVTYNEAITNPLPGFVLATEKLTVNSAKVLNGVYIGLPDDTGQIFAAQINDDPERAGQPFNVVGSLLLNFEINNSDINVIYDIIRVQNFSILSDIINFLQETAV